MGGSNAAVEPPAASARPRGVDMSGSPEIRRAVSQPDRPVEEHPAHGDLEAVTRRLLTRAADTTDEVERQRLHDEAVRRNMRVARAIAGRYRDRGLPTEDLVQVACLGLVKAVRRYDPSLEHDFLAYAVPTIAGEIKRFFRDYGWTVRPPRGIQELQAEVSRARATLSQELGRSPRLDEVAELLGVDVERVIEAVGAAGCYTPASLDVPLGDGGPETLGEKLAGHDPDYSRTEARIVLAPVVRSLPERDRKIIELRFFHGLTQQEIGDRLGVSQMQVSRLLSRILRQLRGALEDPPPPAVPPQPRAPRAAGE